MVLVTKEDSRGRKKNLQGRVRKGYRRQNVFVFWGENVIGAYQAKQGGFPGTVTGRVWGA